MKDKYDEIDATPSKRIYLSIISDYDLKLALCELIDNAIDSWSYKERKNGLEIDIILDYQQQKITVTDNSGGIPANEMKLVVSPGESRSSEESETIGIFGVGSKRAVVAIAQKTAISSRYKSEETRLIEIDDNWIKDDSDWNIPIYRIDNISSNSTIIELNNLRDPIVKEEKDRFINHLGATYSSFLSLKDFNLKFNGELVRPITFESWSYPPSFNPREYSGIIELDNENKVNFEINVGLTRKGDPAGAEYGVYFYCNKRLISRANKSYELGFKTGMAGQPHPSISLVRVIVRLGGKAQLMPWNSSKSEINFKHNTFKAIQEHLIKIVTNYSRASRSMSNEWESKVFKFKKGKIEKINISSLSSGTNLYLVPIPRKTHTKYIDLIKKNNKDLANKKPWVKGVYETIIAVEEISKLKIEQNNRISLLVLDSGLEIAFKDYLVNESGEVYSEKRLGIIMRDRTLVHKEIEKHIKFKSDTWAKVKYFYNMRSELVHKKMTAKVSDSDLKNYRDLVEYIFKKMFKLKFNIPN